MNNTPNDVPVKRSLAKKDGKVVAAVIVNKDTRGSDEVPFGRKHFVRTPATCTKTDETVKDVANEDKVIDREVSDDKTAASTFSFSIFKSDLLLSLLDLLSISCCIFFFLLLST